MCRLCYATTMSICDGVCRVCKISGAEDKNVVFMEKRVGCLHYEQGCARIITYARLKEARGFCIEEECSGIEADSCFGGATNMSSEVGSC